MNDISMIGLGNMGSALAACLIHSGLGVTVWNRSAAKAESLVAAGATLAASPAEAIAASPVTILSVSDYPGSAAILASDDVAAALDGALIVQLSSGTPHEARTLSAWIEARGARYLDGKIMAWPRQIGTPEAAIFLSGDGEAYAAALPLLQPLAGALDHAGEATGTAAAMFNAALAYLAGHWIGFAHGLVIAEAEGIGLAAFGEAMAGFAPMLADDMRHMAAVVADGAYADPESTIAATGHDIARLVQLSREAGIGSAFPAFAAQIFRKGVDAGYGAEEHAAIVKVLRAP